MSTKSTVNLRHFANATTNISGATATFDTPILLQNTVLLDIGQPSSAAGNDIDNMTVDIVGDDESSDDGIGDTNTKQVIFLLFLK